MLCVHHQLTAHCYQRCIPVSYPFFWGPSGCLSASCWDVVAFHSTVRNRSCFFPSSSPGRDPGTERDVSNKEPFSLHSCFLSTSIHLPTNCLWPVLAHLLPLVLLLLFSLFSSHFFPFVLLLVPPPIIGFEKWNTACHISKQRMSQSSAIAATSDGALVSPEGTQEGNEEYLPSSSHQTAATPYTEPWGNSGCENTGYWPQRAEVHIKEWLQWAQTEASSHT